MGSNREANRGNGEQMGGEEAAVSFTGPLTGSTSATGMVDTFFTLLQKIFDLFPRRRRLSVVIARLGFGCKP